ncbi:MAG TPA: histidinol dehydrogenase [Bryobacteraceae bacterium]|nr:histidinol dehydrogenase [Bryobacteraceae bacterium]
MIRILRHTEAAPILNRRTTILADAINIVRPILDAVASEGDDALVRFARKFDGLGDQPLLIPQSELRAAASRLNPAVESAIHTAANNIREFALTQLPKPFLREFSDGRQLGQIVRPLEAVGCYIPSGRYPLPSTLLMTAVLAQTAGVPRIVIASPKPTDEILGAAHMLGLTDVHRIGGAHAVAAMAYGTPTIPRVDRIVGPGNVYVAAAKKLLADEVGIDFIAGPTEILILTAAGNADVIAADMLAQAEHDADAAAILVTTSESLAKAVGEQIQKQLETLSTAATARQAIERNSAIILVPDLETGIALSNRFAPEHLSLHDPSLLPLVQNAGTVFLGENSPESAGDYAAGPSHVLPTSGASRLRGGLSAADFVKVIAIQQLTPSALKVLAPAITTLARAEGLEAHARAVEIRFAQ